jgi:hypothetical protein|tara:strand:- start:114 stop:545 length:432 start_codon:yes stop_codon:yes gene_type:complete
MESNLNQSNSIPLEYDLIFDVVDTFNKTKLGNLCIGDQQWECISGKYGKGALPKGRYKIDNCYKLKPTKGETEAYTVREFPWVATLTPQFETDRTGLLIHPDGNKEGTAGCIGISKKENDVEVYEAITNLLKSKKELILYVNS